MNNHNEATGQPLISDRLHPPFGNYAHGILLPQFNTACRLVFTSGHLGISKDGAIPAEAFSQARLCFGAIEATLLLAGMTASHVVQLRAYVTDRQYFGDYMRARDEFLQERSIASTLLIVSGFTRHEFLVEVEAVAVAPN